MHGTPDMSREHNAVESIRSTQQDCAVDNTDTQDNAQAAIGTDYLAFPFACDAYLVPALPSSVRGEMAFVSVRAQVFRAPALRSPGRKYAF